MRPAEIPPRIHRNLSHPIDRFQVLGDRCSGTNFVSHLVERNFPELAPTTELGWKHGFIDRRIAGRPGLLTIVVYRHPTRWLQSFHRNPFQVSRSVADLPFAGFIRARWEPAWVTDLSDGTVREEPIQSDMYPHTTNRFENVCRMRTVKVGYLEELASLPCQVTFLAYEAVNRRPAEVLNALAKVFDLHPVQRVVPVLEYKGVRQVSYRPATYPAVAPDDASFIRRELDLRQEAQLGYCIERVDAHDGVPWFDIRRLRAALKPRK